MDFLAKRSFAVISTYGPGSLAESSGAYTIYDHTYDAIVIGAGGAGLRAS
jgi:hypothetical protein